MSFAADQQFFQQHPDRRAHIRLPLERTLAKNKQRAVFFISECEAEFRALGDHDKKRRRILLYRLPPENQYYDKKNPQILKIPMLAFSDETISDTDAVLLPIIEELMQDAAQKQGMA